MLGKVKEGSDWQAHLALALALCALSSPVRGEGTPAGTDIVNVATITVKGAGKKGADLVSKVTLPTPLPTTVITLADSADTAVTNAQVTITVVSTKTTTTVVPGFGLYDDKGNLQDQIQFQWVNYSTSSYTGPGGGSTCALSNRLCVGQTVLWR